MGGLYFPGLGWVGNIFQGWEGWSIFSRAGMGASYFPGLERLHNFRKLKYSLHFQELKFVGYIFFRTGDVDTYRLFIWQNKIELPCKYIRLFSEIIYSDRNLLIVESIKFN